jgi:hypothetical protein
LDDAPHNRESRPRIPIIGRLTVFELVGFIGVILGAVFGVLGIVAFSPLLKDISAPGSGGGAQMLLAMFVFPALFVSGALALSGCVGFVLLLRAVKARLDGRTSGPQALGPARTDLRALKQPMEILTISFIIQILCIFLPAFVSVTSFEFNIGIGLTTIVAGLVFLVCLGMLAARLGRNWILWVVLTILTPPFGPLIAYFMMRKAVRDAVGMSNNSAT